MFYLITNKRNDSLSVIGMQAVNISLSGCFIYEQLRLYRFCPLELIRAGFSFLLDVLHARLPSHTHTETRSHRHHIETQLYHNQSRSHTYTQTYTLANSNTYACTHSHIFAEMLSQTDTHTTYIYNIKSGIDGYAERKGQFEKLFANCLYGS